MRRSWLERFLPGWLEVSAKKQKKKSLRYPRERCCPGCVLQQAELRKRADTASARVDPWCREDALTRAGRRSFLSRTHADGLWFFNREKRRCWNCQEPWPFTAFGHRATQASGCDTSDTRYATGGLQSDVFSMHFLLSSTKHGSGGKVYSVILVRTRRVCTGVVDIGTKSPPADGAPVLANSGPRDSGSRAPPTLRSGLT